MMKYFLFYFLVCFALVSCKARKDRYKEEWIQLFNREDLSGWKIKIAKQRMTDNFNHTFRVEDSILKVDYSDYDKFNGEFGHLFYEKPFSYYKIRVEYRFTGHQLKGGPDYAYLNSGVMLHAQSPSSMGLNQSFPVSLEMQLLGSDSSRKRTDGNLCTPGTYVSMNGKPVFDHCINSSSGNSNAGDWITAEAIVFGDSIIQHLINGSTVLTYNKPQIGGGFIDKSTPWANFGFGADSTDWIQKEGMPLKSGYIALQAESFPVEFRKVELLNLEGCKDKKALNYKAYYIKADNSTCEY